MSETDLTNDLPAGNGPRHNALLHTADEAAYLLSCGRSTVYELMASGRLRSVKLGRSRRIARAEIERFVAELQDGNA